MNDQTSKPPNYSRLLIAAGLSSLLTVGLTHFFHGSPTLVLCVGLVTLALMLSIGLFVRSRFQLSLRTLTLLLTISAVLMGLFGSRMNAARIQKQAINSVLGLRSSSGMYPDPYSDVHYEYAELDSDFFTTQGGWLLPIWVVDVLGKDFFFAVNDIGIQNQDLSANDSLDSVQLEQFSSLFISNCKLSDGAFERVLQQKQLRDLTLIDVDLNDDHLAAIAKTMPKLTRLQIGYARMRPQTTCSVTDDGVHHLLSLRELKELTIDNSKATGECLHDLAKLPKLQHLSCSRLVMSEANVQSFRDFKTLKSIVMYETIVDEQWIPFLESLNLEWVAFTLTDKSRVDEILDRNGKPTFAVD